jgi:hypothetical protein
MGAETPFLAALRQVRRREGRYLLRTNLTGKGPAELWRFYIQLVIEAAFKTMKDDLHRARSSVKLNVAPSGATAISTRRQAARALARAAPSFMSNSSRSSSMAAIAPHRPSRTRALALLPRMLTGVGSLRAGAGQWRARNLRPFLGG